jgi:hypothetical protein
MKLDKITIVKFICGLIISVLMVIAFGIADIALSGKEIQSTLSYDTLVNLYMLGSTEVIKICLMGSFGYFIYVLVNKLINGLVSIRKHTEVEDDMGFESESTETEPKAVVYDENNLDNITESDMEKINSLKTKTFKSLKESDRSLLIRYAMEVSNKIASTGEYDNVNEYGISEEDEYKSSIVRYDKNNPNPDLVILDQKLS